MRLSSVAIGSLAAAATVFSGCGGSEQGLHAVPNSAIALVEPNATEHVIYSFGATPSLADGYYPDAGLTEAGGMLYGTATHGGNVACTDSYPGCGVVFSIKLSSGKERVLHAFTGKDGANPQAPLIDVSGTLYGTTEYGGMPNGNLSPGGTVFSVTKSGKEHELHSFGYETDGMAEDGQGNLYVAYRGKHSGSIAEFSGGLG
jgi:hypothetical protein